MKRSFWRSRLDPDLNPQIRPLDHDALHRSPITSHIHHRRTCCPRAQTNTGEQLLLSLASVRSRRIIPQTGRVYKRAYGRIWHRVGGMKAASKRCESEFFFIFESKFSINTRPRMAEWVPASPQRTRRKTPREPVTARKCCLYNVCVFAKRVRQTAGSAHVPSSSTLFRCL